MTRRLACCLLFAAAPVRAFEVGVSYFAVPGTFEYARADLDHGTFTGENKGASFGTLGLRAVLDLPARLGPVNPALMTGFGVSAGSQSFDHRDLVVYDPGNASLYTHAQKHDGDLTEVSATILPVMMLLRTGGPAAGVTFTGEVGVGLLAVNLDAARTETQYDVTDTRIVLKQTTRSQQTGMTFAAMAGFGLSVPATAGMDLKAVGGVTWLDSMSWTTTDELAQPVIIDGGTPADPGLTIGGLGFYLRLGLSVNL